MKLELIEEKVDFNSTRFFVKLTKDGTSKYIACKISESIMEYDKVRTEVQEYFNRLVESAKDNIDFKPKVIATWEG